MKNWAGRPKFLLKTPCAPHGNGRNASEKKNNRQNIFCFMIPKKYFWYSFIFYIAIYTVITIISADYPFFWDKDILDSIQAHWLLETNFNFNFPNEIDSGHPPVMSFMLAVLWKIFGRQLVIGHILMFIISAGTAYQILRFIRFFVPEKFIFPVSLFVLLDTSIMAQSVVVSGDLILFFCFFLAINSVLYSNKWLLFLGLAGLCIINMRGLLSGLIIFGFHVFQLYDADNKVNLKRILHIIPPYVGALILPALFYYWHYVVKGWVVYYPESEWAGCYEIVGFQGFLRNIVIVTWRFLDFGRVFLWGFALILLVYKGKSAFRNRQFQSLMVLFILTVIVYVPPMLRYQTLSSHRYILPSMAVFAVISGFLLFTYVRKYKWMLFAVLFIGLQSGHFWIYPEKLAQGWDATMAHVPYYSLKQKMIDYLKEENIKFNHVGTVTPNKNPMKYVHLNNETKSFADKDFENNKYMFYSNTMNDFSDDEIEKLNKKWSLVKEFEKRGVFVKLYETSMSK
jgi:hypothetical protein